MCPWRSITDPLPWPSAGTANNKIALISFGINVNHAAIDVMVDGDVNLFVGSQVLQFGGIELAGGVLRRGNDTSRAARGDLASLRRPRRGFLGDGLKRRRVFAKPCDGRNCARNAGQQTKKNKFPHKNHQKNL